jgi:hypothetical protein
MGAIVPASRAEWRLPHDGAFLLAATLGAGAMLKLVAPLLAGVGVVAGFLVGGASLTGHRLGYVPTKVLLAVAGAAIVSILAYVAFLLAFLLFGGLCCS